MPGHKRVFCVPQFSVLHTFLQVGPIRQSEPVPGSNQGILKGEVSLFCRPPVWLVWNQLYDNWQFLFLFTWQTNQTNQTGGQLYSDTPLVFPGQTWDRRTSLVVDVLHLIGSGDEAVVAVEDAEREVVAVLRHLVALLSPDFSSSSMTFQQKPYICG